MRYWSLIPEWWSGSLLDVKFSTFNARSEEIDKKAAFMGSWLNAQRCLIPATWFYEFESIKNQSSKIIKIPYLVKSSDENIFTMAGIYNDWTNSSGVNISTVAILTKQSEKELVKIHSRQPVIIKKKSRDMWLEKKTTMDDISNLMKQDCKLDFYQISRRFNAAFGSSVTPELLEPSNMLE